MKVVQRWTKTLTLLSGALLAFGFIGAQAQDQEFTYNSHVAKIIN